MGINGLLRSFQRLKSVQSKGKKSHNILEFRGKRLAIDASCLLYKAAYCCAERLVESIDKMGPEVHADAIAEKAYTGYVLRQCDMLLTHAGIEEIMLVFDSPHRLPLKKGESDERDKKRKENLEEARRLKSLGRRNEAWTKYKAAIKVTNRMAQVTAGAVRKKYGNFSSCKVKCIFAPFEADAQLAKLCSDGVVDVCMTEDSDVLVYLAASNCTSPVIYKFEKSNGQCDVFCLDWLINDEKEKKNIKSLALFLAGETDSFASALRFMARREQQENGSGRRMFIQACVLSGCDYVPHLDGIGPIKAFKLVQENAFRKPEIRFSHILRSLRGSRAVSKTVSKATTSKDDMAALTEYHVAPLNPNRMNENELADYEVQLAKSEAAFYYHHVSTGRKMVPLQPLYFSDNVDNDDSIFRHQPCMSRFKGDVSFIGSVKEASKSAVALKVSSYNLFGNACIANKPVISKESYLNSSTTKGFQDGGEFSPQRAEYDRKQSIVCAKDEALPPPCRSPVSTVDADQPNQFSCFSYSVRSSKGDTELNIRDGARDSLKFQARRVSTDSESDFEKAERVFMPKNTTIHSDASKYFPTKEIILDGSNRINEIHDLSEDIHTNSAHCDVTTEATNQPKLDPWSDDDSECMIIESPKLRSYPSGQQICSDASCRAIPSVVGATQYSKKISRGVTSRQSTRSPLRHIKSKGSRILAGFAKQQALYRQIHPVNRDSTPATKRSSGTSYSGISKKRKSPSGPGVTLQNYFKKKSKM